MNFSESVIQRIEPIIQKYGLHILEQRDDYLKLQSNVSVIIIAHNKFENSNILFVGNIADKMVNEMVEIDNIVMRSFFNSDLRLAEVDNEHFINNLVVFFNNEAKPILEGDAIKLIELKEFSNERAAQYTRELLLRQKLRVIDEAWANNNYKQFIAAIDEIDLGSVSPSYQLKYKIAKKK